MVTEDDSLRKKAIIRYRQEGAKRLFFDGLRYIQNRFFPDILNPRYGYLNTLTDRGMFLGHIKETIIRPLNERLLCYQDADKGGVNVMDEDWDNLVILDACRFDVFKQSISLDAEVSQKRSIGPRTPLFVERTFSDKQYHDTVYITANPHVQRFAGEKTFHQLYQVWRTDWSDEYQSVLPEAVSTQAKKAAEKYPNKRLIIHYMQPHDPFIGISGHEFTTQHDFTGFGPKGSGRTKIYDAKRNGLIDTTDEELWSYYTENLERVLDEVYPLLDEIEGKTVITADHGELIGDVVGPLPVKEYEHPKLHVDKLLAVPWLEIRNGPRRNIFSDPPSDDTEWEDELAIERLKSLGYY